MLLDFPSPNTLTTNPWLIETWNPGQRVKPANLTRSDLSPAKFWYQGRVISMPRHQPFTKARKFPCPGTNLLPKLGNFQVPNANFLKLRNFWDQIYCQYCFNFFGCKMIWFDGHWKNVGGKIRQSNNDQLPVPLLSG